MGNWYVGNWYVDNRYAGNRVSNCWHVLRSFFFSPNSIRLDSIRLDFIFRSVRLTILEYPADHDVLRLDGHQLLARQCAALGIQAVGLAQARAIERIADAPGVGKLRHLMRRST